MALVAVSAVTPQGQAQTTIDVSKVNCEQWSAFKVAVERELGVAR